LSDSNIAIEKDPNYGKAYYRRGVAHLNIGNIVEAKRDFEKAQELEPSKVTQEKVTISLPNFNYIVASFYP
jgi:Flp pilus assembly protein TadD